MKSDTRNTPITTKDLAQRVAAPQVPTSDLEAELLALDQEEESLKRRKSERRQQYWEVAIASLASSVDKLVAAGFERPAIGKALGFVGSAKATPLSKSGRGPATHDGWYTIFLSLGIRSYLKVHPDLASTLKAGKIPSASYSSHIPPADLSLLETVARSKAQAKVPAVIPTEVPSK
jgi:hypothetical protein